MGDVSEQPPIAEATTVDGVRIAWTSSGAGPVLVMLPPVPFSDFSAEWRLPVMRDVFRRLASRLRVVQLDGRGTGHSQRDIGDLSFEDALRDIDVVLDTIGGETRKRSWRVLRKGGVLITLVAPIPAGEAEQNGNETSAHQA